MFWIGFIVGIFFGANIGIVVAGLLISTKRSDTKDHLVGTFMDHAVIDEVQEDQGKLPLLPKPITCLDRYPHS